MKTASQADEIMAHAKRLRQSPNQAARKIFINRHLTAAQSKAAYEERCRRRAVHQQRAAKQNNPTTATSMETNTTTMATTDMTTEAVAATVSDSSSFSLHPTASAFVPASQISVPVLPAVIAATVSNTASTSNNLVIPANQTSRAASSSQ
jgi:hypothetical protein